MRKKGRYTNLFNQCHYYYQTIQQTFRTDTPWILNVSPDSADKQHRVLDQNRNARPQGAQLDVADVVVVDVDGARGCLGQSEQANT